MADIVTMFKNAYNYAINVMLHPGEATKNQMSVGDALKFYYILAIIPLILGVIISLVFGAHVSSSLMAGIPLGGLLGGALVLSIVLIYIVVLPIGIIISSGFYHLIIKSLFHMYKQNYNAVLAAYTYAMVPLVLIYWLVSVPILGTALVLLFGLWSFIILIIAIANQLIMSRLKSLGTILLSNIVLSIIIFVIIFTFALLFAGLGFMTGLFTPYSISSTGSPTIPYTGSINTSAGISGSPVSASNASTVAPAPSSSANYASCGSFILSDSNFSNSISGICTWNGGALNVSIAGGNSGYATVSIVGSDGKTYFSEGTAARCLTSSGSFYAPAQQYTVKLSTGRGGGNCGADVVALSG